MTSPIHSIATMSGTDLAFDWSTVEYIQLYQNGELRIFIDTKTVDRIVFPPDTIFANEETTRTIYSELIKMWQTWKLHERLIS